MSHNNEAPIDTLRLSPRDREKLVESINRQNRSMADSGKRRSPRIRFTGTVIVLLSNPNGSTVKYSVTPRNLSSQGLGFIHGQFIHQHLACQIILPTRSGEWVRVLGKIVGCRHASGLVHQVSVCFDEVIDLQQFVSLSPEEEQANQDALAARDAQTAAGNMAKLEGTVLLIDEFESDRQLYTLWLNTQGLNVLPASEQRQVSKILAEGTKIHLVLLDVYGGSETELALVKEIRKAGYVGPMIATSSDEREEVEAAALAAGCNAFLNKPIEKSAFLLAIDQMLSFDPNVAHPNDKEPIRSTLAGDAQMKPLLRRFLCELSTTLDRLKLACEDKDMSTISKLCHQLKGAGGSFGFAAVTQMARLALGQLQQPRPDPNAIQHAIADLIAVGKRLAVD